MSQEPIEGEATEVDAEQRPPTSTAIVHAPPGERRVVQHEVIKPLDREEVVAAMREHQQLLHDLLTDDDWQGQPGQSGSFVKKSGWRKIALAYNLTVERVSEEVDRDEDGKPLRASYTARAVAATGRAVEATGHCAFSESRFSGPRGNTTKLENDMRATAETRAKNRAISDLIGMGKVSAEEVDAGAGGGPANGPRWTGKRETVVERLAFLMDPGDGPRPEEAEQVVKWVEEDCGGYLPASVARAVTAAHGATKKMADALKDQ